ncbi:MAG: hypothetical protein JSS95_09650 [Acidobacteria bacterium]|nr:hypothetical protein [Acidobacteriota bacterium]
MSSAVLNLSNRFSLSSGSPASTHILRDSASILRMQPALTDLGRYCGMPGALDDLGYFLSWLDIRRKSPCMVMLAGGLGTEPSVIKAQAGMLLYEHRIAGLGMRIFTSFDNTGRRTLVPAAIDSSQFAQLVCRSLLDHGAQSILLTFRHDGQALTELLKGSGYGLRWATRERVIAGYLQLKSTFEETLATMGSRTRNHLRYYRRRAEKDLGCEFVPEVEISREDFLALNRISSYPSTGEIAGWKYDSFRELKQPVLSGLRDRDGRWLSLVGGLHADRNMEMFWQINRNDMKPYSLGTVMRCFLVEHELKCGTRRLYFEGGTSHSMSHSFVQEKCTDLFVMRDNLVARQVPALFKRYVPKENPINEFFEDTSLEWKTTTAR